MGQRPKMQKEGFAQADFSFFVQVTGNLQILLEDRLPKKEKFLVFFFIFLESLLGQNFQQ